MEVAAPTLDRPAALELRAPDMRAVAAFVLPFALIVYLGLRGGGYDPVVRGEVGVAVWWVLLIGTAAGLVPVSRIGVRGWVALGLLAALAGSSALAISWSESAERSVVEVGRVLTYAGVLALALASQTRRPARHAVAGVAAGVTAIAILAVLSRLHPSWFPANDAARFLPQVGRRLNYPLNYWNGLAALTALGLPLLLALASTARTVAARVAAGAAVPVVALCAYLTLSRGGAIAAATGIVLFVALSGRRLSKLPTLIVAAGGAALAILAATQRDAFQNGDLTALARHQANEIVPILLVVCAGVALLTWGLALAERRVEEPRWLRRARPKVAAAAGLALLALAMGVLVGGLPSSIDRSWQNFKKPTLSVAAQNSDRAARFQSASGRGRYQYWQSTTHAEQSRPLKGIGPGTFEFWWSRHGTVPGFVRDAHSLYMETYGELGVPGLAIVAAFLLFVLGTGVVRTLRARGPTRTWLAAATGGCAAFCVSAAVDWVWELPVLPIAFMSLAAALLVSSPRPSRLRQWTRRRRLALRAGAAAVSLAALAAIVPPLLAISAVRSSQQAAADGRLGDALSEARSAARAQPYAAAPKLQLALVLESEGGLGSAAAAAHDATHAEPTNWRTWLIVARIEAERGRAPAAAAAYRRAHSLDPRSAVFTSLEVPSR